MHCHSRWIAAFLTWLAAPLAALQWVVCGADDMYVRVYNYNTMVR